MNVVRGCLSSLISLVILASSPAAATAQSGRIITDRITCTRGSIVLEPLARLGDAEGPGAIGTLHTATRDSRGRFYVVSRETSFQIQVFDASGRYRQTIGSRGQGPGEYQRVSAVLVRPGDTLEVLDPRQSRRTVLGPDYKVVEWTPFRLSLRHNGVTRLGDGRLVIATMVPTEERGRFPLHLVDSASILLSFGPEAPEMQSGDDRRPERSLATTVDRKGFWSVSQREYFQDTVIEVIDPARGVLIASRRVPQFLHSFVDPATALSRTESADGVPRVQV